MQKLTSLSVFILFGALATSAQQQPEMTALTASFVPGEKTIFFDDFSDLSPGAAPARFKVRGAGVELRAAGETKQLTVLQRASLFPNLTALPKNFTMEAEVKMDVTNRILAHWIFTAGAKQALVMSLNGMAKDSEQRLVLHVPKYEELGRKRMPVDWSKPVKLALWVQDGRLRTYINGEQHLDFNQVELPPIDKVELATEFYGQNQALGYRMVRFAESAPDFSQMIAASGRYVTHGILFDTGSDRLKPESAPVIQTIAKGLEANAKLRLLIEGHTDAVGSAPSNLDLSKRRAEAVKSVLVTQFKVDAARLNTAGLGASKPIDSNDTPQGRAQNRRVEFVRQ
ncbi:MAG: OmpA family protein [Bryobacteraceae bacterium]|nr:OmpA family protein [Bryobacteraceae bacterium]